MIEKKIHSVDFTNPYENSIERKPEILETVESNYKIIRRVYQHIYTDIADIFFEYIHSLDLDGELKIYLILKMLWNYYLFFKHFIKTLLDCLCQTDC